MNESTSELINNLKFNRNTIVNNIINNNMDIQALSDVVRILKDDNTRENSVMWFLKTKDNYNQIINIFRKTILITAEISSTKNSEAYMSLYNMYDNLSRLISNLLLSEKVVKRMDYQDFQDYLNIIASGALALENILSLDIVQKNPTRLKTMKEQYRNIQLKAREYEHIKKHKKEINKKELLKKGLTFAAGFVAGAGMSCVPGVGTIRMGLAATKVTTSIINAWGDKHPNGKIAKVINKIDNGLNNKFPRINEKIRSLKDKLRNNNINVFVNGISVGYIVGNIFELVAGQTIFDYIGDQLNGAGEQSLDIKFVEQPTTTTATATTTEVPTPEVTTQTTIISPIETTDTTIIDPITSDPITDFNPIIDESVVDIVPSSSITDVADTIDLSQSFDASSIDYGYYSSFDPEMGKAPLKLFNDLGHNVHIGSENVLSDGTKMFALFQEDGTGYAWVKADDVMKIFTETPEKVMSLTLTK